MRCGRGPPLDEGHQRAGMGLQRCAVIINAVQHDGGNREHHARRRELAFGEDVMDQAAVHAAVAVLERMDIDKAEGGGRCFQHRVNAVLAHAVVRLQQAVHQIVQIARPRPDEFRERVAVVVPFA